MSITKIIDTVSDQRFSLNGIEYLKNYVTEVHGSKIEVFNCYERNDVLIELTDFSEFKVNGEVYTTAAQLQAALLHVLYSRSTLGGDSPDSAIIPSLQQVATIENILTDTPVFVNTATKKLKISGPGLDYKENDKQKNIRFETPDNNDADVITLIVPSKAADDTFAMMSDVAIAGAQYLPD